MTPRRIGLPLITLLIVIAVLFGFGATWAGAVTIGPAAPQTLCGRLQVAKTTGSGTRYVAVNDVWGTADQQCITTRANGKPGFRVTTSAPRRGGQVQAYPFILDGCFFGLCTHDSGFPVQVSRIKSLKVSWFTYKGAPGVWNTSIDTYLTPKPKFTTAGGLNSASDEVMVWLRASGMTACSVAPGQVCRIVTIAGIKWRLNYWHQTPPQALPRMYYQFRSVVARSSLHAYQLAAVYRWLTVHHMVKASLYLQGIQAGDEIIRGAGGPHGVGTNWVNVALTKTP